MAEAADGLKLFITNQLDQLDEDQLLSTVNHIARLKKGESVELVAKQNDPISPIASDSKPRSHQPHTKPKSQRKVDKNSVASRLGVAMRTLMTEPSTPAQYWIE